MNIKIKKNLLNMQKINKFSKSVWKKQEKKFKKCEEKIKIPNKNLDEVDYIVLKKRDDFDKIPDSGGCYWIWTNEPVKHRFHKNKIPERFNRGEVIYNGIAKDNVQQRIKHHLLSQNPGWSGISLDIYLIKTEPTSHRKKALSPKGKVPYINCAKIKGKKGDYFECNPIRKKEQLLELNLSKEEKHFIENSSLEKYFFRNSIYIFEGKHRKYIYKVYFITGLETLYLEYIEKRWRKEFGLPKLCTYLSGR
ncbi:hypothetical protein ES703_67150 [subsurface metagenome]